MLGILSIIPFVKMGYGQMSARSLMDVSAGWPGRNIRVRCGGGLSMVLLQLIDPLYS